MDVRFLMELKVTLTSYLRHIEAIFLRPIFTHINVGFWLEGRCIVHKCVVDVTDQYLTYALRYDRWHTDVMAIRNIGLHI